ncbi:MAG TPA: DNA-directed RNA polymerase subunit omega [Clostridium sp.]|jgi:DNA-directed RNA polymerase subunit omega|nr:DNA-directed RNA polymerase subunit omega [Clostridium sp.]
MINPSIVDLLEKVDNRYSLVVATSRRARKIIEGEEPMVQGVGTKALTIAINEVEQGAIEVREAEDKFTKTREVELVNEEAEEGLNFNE